MGDVVEKVAVEIEGRDTGAAASLKATADVVQRVTALMRELHRTSADLARETVRNGQQAARAEAEKARAAERSSAALVALQQRAEQQRKAILARGDPLAQLRLQLQQEIAAYRQLAAQVVGQEEQKQRTLRAIRERYLAAKKAILAEEQRAESAAASGGGAVRPGQPARPGIQGLRRFNEPLEGARMALGALGATSNTAVGQLAFLGQAFANVGAKAGILGAALVGAGAGLTALVSHMQKVAAEERQLAAMGRVWGVTARDVNAVESAWRELGVELERGAVLKLIATAREADVSTAQMIALGRAAKDAAEASGTSFEEGFVRKLQDVESAADSARTAFLDLVEARKKADREAMGGGAELVAGRAAMAAADSEVQRIENQRRRLYWQILDVQRGSAPADMKKEQEDALRDQMRAYNLQLDAARAHQKQVRDELRAAHRAYLDAEELAAREEQAAEDARRGEEQARARQRIREDAERRQEQEAQARARAHEQLLAQVKKQREELADAEWGSQFSPDRARIETEHRKRMRAIMEGVAARRAGGLDDEADTYRERAMAEEKARYSRDLADLQTKEAKERAAAEKREAAEALRVKKDAKDTLKQQVDYFVIGMRAGEQYITGLKAALEAKKTKDKVAGVLKTIGSVLSMIPTPETQAAGSVFSFFGSLASAFHDGGAVGVRGERLTAHDGRYIDQGRRPVWALPGEGFLDVATTALVGGSRGIERLNRAAETGGTAGLGGGVHIGGISVRIDGSKIDNLAALERAIGPALERAIVHNVGRVPRRIGREIGPLTR